MGTINNQILNFADKLIPISDFSKGKTAQIFEDVKNNNAEFDNLLFIKTKFNCLRIFLDK